MLTRARILASCAALTLAYAAPLAAAAPLPERLSETGLHVPGTDAPGVEALGYSPQYPLWSDGASKRRWLRLPPGSSIDASDPDAWDFPRGTRAWKEFAHAGRPIETRYIERLEDGSWRFATYVWDADGREAWLAPASGISSLPVAGAPGGRYAIPSRDDCRACHEGGAVTLLGFSALQLSPYRETSTPPVESAQPGDVDLPGLHERGLIRNLPPSLLRTPPRIAIASAVGRAALGYLHGNCGHCHNDFGPLAELDLSLLQSVVAAENSVARTLATTVGRDSEFAVPGIAARIAPGEPAASMLLARMRSRNPLAQMPPLGSRVSDAEAAALVEWWIEHELIFQENEP